LNRVSGVLFTVFAVGSLLLVIGGTLSSQVAALLAELPQNRATIKEKIKSLRELATGPTTQEFGQMGEEIKQELRLTPTHCSSLCRNRRQLQRLAA